MITYHRVVTVSLVALLFIGVSSVIAGKPRKLPVGTYISSAKIEIIAGQQDESRYQTAIAMLDSLFLHYGPHAEGLFWMAQLNVDLAEKKSDLKEKLPFIEKLIAYADSLHICCDNKDIKKKYRKDCKKYTEKTDSTRVFFWQRFYNGGVEQIDEINNISKDLLEETDSTAREFYQNRREAMIDSCKDNMTLAIALDPTDARPYIGLASVYEKTENYEISIEWLEKALENAVERDELVTQIAYNYIRLNKYCDAIPFFQEKVNVTTSNVELMADTNVAQGIVGTMYNLSICYNNCNEYDSAKAIHHRILEIDPHHTDALTGLGRYYNQLARWASDSSNVYKDAGDEAGKEQWREISNSKFDTALVYFKQVFELKENDRFAAEEYAIIGAIRGQFEEAAIAFERATSLDPGDAGNWTSLGDCNVNLHNWQAAADAYEKVVELEPGNREVWERLKDLYTELRNKERLAEVNKVLETL